jgi:hypothetical protein
MNSLLIEYHIRGMRRILPSSPDRKDLDLLAKFVYLGGFSMELHTQIQLYAVIEAHLKVTIVECSGNVCQTTNGSFR